MKVKTGQPPEINLNPVHISKADGTAIELTSIIDTEAVQSLFNDFYRLVHIPMALFDLKGNVLVSAGWQDICTKFHRVNPETCKYCIESDQKLSLNVAPGKYKLYKCRNNIWDVVTPIMVEGQHIGNIFSGQFLFEDEPLDYELFRSQARKYGFNEEEYIKALEKIPRLSREDIDTGMAFFMTFANMISQLSYSSIKLSQSLAERDAVVEALQEREKREKARSDELAAVLDAVPVAVYTTHDPQALKITGNRLSCKWLRIPPGTNLSKSALEGEKPEFFKLFKDGVEIPPEKMSSQLSAAGIEVNDCELDIVSADGRIRHVLGNARPLRDENGNLRGSISAFIDITERKRVEEALRKSEEHLRLLSDNLPDSAVYQYTLDPDGSGCFQYVSAGIERLIGLNSRDILNDPSILYRIIPSQYMGELIEAGVRSAHELSDFDMELPVELPDGRLKWIRLNSRPRRLPEGRTIWDGVLTDITRLKRAEEVLRESESCRKVAEAVDTERRRFFDVLETLPVMIALLTPDHRIAFANRPFREMFGNSGNRHCFEHCFRNNEPCDSCKAYKILETGQPYHWEITTPEGRVFDTYNLPFIDVDGSRMTLEMDIDITERKAAEEMLRDSEEKYRNIVETANEIILITDNEAVINYANSKLVDMLEYPLDEVIGKPIWGFISKECIPAVRQNLEKRRQGISESYELKLIRKDGSPVWTFLNAKPLFDRNGSFTGVMSMLTDISKRKEAEEALANIETARKKEIHHRIKNNLQVISSLLDLQADQFKNREDIKDMEVLSAFRESQDRVISMALIHEELYRGSGFETLNFSPYIQELTENLFNTYSLGDTRITLSMDMEEDLFFNMDTAVPLGMIVNELVSNSLKHAFGGRDKGEICIQLYREKLTKFKSEESEGTVFVLKISDNGLGIPEIDVENLDSLGMQLVTSLVDQLDGKLELKRNNGTEFIIRFKVTDKENKVQFALKSSHTSK
ncbi:histidine kinase [Methanosarcina mazei]|uniref:Histidine kinase n=1 Tax=Methanosarcina mazei TaxID=2209 RepID=A0A0F8JF73_METMZ|nr:histidine kinase [Methanosarcina mazei]